MRWRGTVALLLTAAAFAEDKAPPPAPKSAPADDDGIAVAKREFDAVKAATRGQRETMRLNLSGLATPELQIADPSATPLVLPRDPTAAATAAKKKSDNWLVDAMAESEKERDRRPSSFESRRTAKTDDKSLNPSDESEKIQADAKSDADSNQASPPPTPPAVANPLDRYMSSWMTVQDYSLLHSVARTDAASAAAPQGSALSTLDGGSLPADTPVDALGLLQTRPAAAAPPEAPRDNPFLQSVDQSLTLSSLTPPPAAIAPPASAAPTLAAPLEAPPPPKSVRPDFVKPRDDDKYYKPMKRF